MYKITISNRLKIHTVDTTMLAEIEAYCTFMWNETKYGHDGVQTIPHISKMYRHIEGGMETPVGLVHWLIEHYGQPADVKYETSSTPIFSDIHFEGDLRENQIEAFDTLAKIRFGTVRADTGSGKTVLAVALTREHMMRTLFIVPKRKLMYQTVEKYQKFLPGISIGMLGDGHKDINGFDVVVGIINSVHEYLEEVNEAGFGLLFVDEAHRIGDNRYLEVLKTINPHVRIALTATPYRYDGFEAYMKYFCGAILLDMKHDDPPVLFTGKIENKMKLDGFDLSREYKAWETRLYNDPQRYIELIETLSLNVGAFGHNALVVVGRVEAAKMLVEILTKKGITAVEYTSQNNDESIIEDFEDGKTKVLVATIQMISEGIDIPDLKSVYNTVVFKDKKTAVQLAGRLRRGSGYKWFYDLIDDMQYCKNAYYTRSAHYGEGGRCIPIPNTIKPNEIIV